MKKYIFISGGVCSSLGKGLAATSLANLLESRGLNIQMIKIDPYLNVDAGTMSPYQHGEVYVTDDGAETDLDLGSYARFTRATIRKANSITTGQIYQSVISKEREGRYLGRTVQIIPHITDEIKRRIIAVGKQPGVDVSLIEIGGTVGDYESIPYLEAARQMGSEMGSENVLFVHLTLVPEVGGGELKTKPTQHSVKELRELGIQPDILICRAPIMLSNDMIHKISSFTNVKREAVIIGYDLTDTIYELPLVYREQKVDDIVVKQLKLKAKEPDLTRWAEMVEVCKNSAEIIRIGIVGKYIHLPDSYKSIYEALTHGGIANRVKVSLVKIDSETLENISESEMKKSLGNLDGILIPGGFGSRGTLGMIQAAEFARISKIPTFGICLGMQIFVIEYSRHVLGLADADSTEFRPETLNPVISLLEEQLDVTDLGGTMRLGKSESHLIPGTKIHAMYNNEIIFERHRQRYEVSNSYRDRLSEGGLIISGYTPEGELVESIEWPDHPWGVGVQFHPEFKSTPIDSHPLFAGFIRASKEHAHQR
ncbi:MAG: CTP synthase [Spirochaetales bacterium]|jgi:CTP synthase|nr:CTP synthase [Spirochaetales bacterium]